MSLPVIIIGAGPTGLMLALELSRLQIPFRIFDAQSNAKPAYQSRALSVHPRTFELLVRHGIAERLAAAGPPMHSMRLFARRRLCVEIDFPGNRMSDTMFPYTHFVNQSDTEDILTDRLREYGGVVEWDMRAESVLTDEDGKGVSVRLRRGDGTEEEVRGQYVVGCDGAHSTVRKAAKIKFEGSTYPQDFILTDARVEWEQKHGTQLFIGLEGYLAFFPLKQKGYYRIVCRHHPRTKGATDYKTVSSSTSRNLPKPTLSDFEDIIAALVPGTTRLYDTTWSSSFRIHRRIASTYRSGRIFLAGDAAHIHAPVGGQGMNSGMQDAVNLGWKLARVLRSNAPTNLLDSYDAERHKVGKAILHSTDHIIDLLSLSHPLLAWMRDKILRYISPLVGGSDKRVRLLSQLGIRYRKSIVVGTAYDWTGKLRGGDRAPNGWVINTKGQQVALLELWKEPVDHLVFFVGTQNFDPRMIEDAEHDVRKWARSNIAIHTIHSQRISEKGLKEGLIDVDGRVHAQYQFTRPGYVLVRPDGHISFIGTWLSFRELKTWMHFQRKGLSWKS